MMGDIVKEFRKSYASRMQHYQIYRQFLRAVKDKKNPLDNQIYLS